MGTLSDGSTQALTAGNWRSSKPSVASIRKNAIVRGKRPGTVTITATYGSLSATASLTVPQDNSLRAIFFDGEGHVIRYAATVPPGGNSLQFLSDAAPAGTRCRMTYT